ncbi:UNVERIFIED_CONTAM: hypothetical protein Scaly_2765000 [Sesamum calycinum]|uniref:DUF4485 domain-containing protein n=1 Tax=Sesamum calycinum TaxID=2727403 RepID=A0AAW2IZ24_9LAMI
MNAHRDLKIISNRPELELDEHKLNVMPKAIYTLGKEQKRRVCEWIRGLKFPDGYASSLARCVDMMKLRMHGMKSHDCYVLIQKLISIAFREIFPKHVWRTSTEIMSIGAPFPLGRGRRGQTGGHGRGHGPPSPPRAKPADPAPATPSIDLLGYDLRDKDSVNSPEGSIISPLKPVSGVLTLCN